MRRFLCTVLVVLLLLSFPGCMMISYEDTNGEDDFSLQTLTDQDIIGSSSCSKYMSSTTTMGNRTVCKVQTMSGVESLFQRRVENQRLDILVSCAVTKGNARLVLVVDDTIVHEFALNKDNQHLTLENVTGKVSLKLAGESTGYTVTFEWK